jgi:3-oxoacyl-[acyl-carrier protein] reductase
MDWRKEKHMGRLSGKSTVVTGSAVGIGREIAILFGREGADVIVNYSKSQAEAEETAAQVRATGARVQVVQADVARQAEAERLIQTAVGHFGRLDVLVNNAAITRFVDFADLDGLTEEVWDVLYDVNVKGTFWCCRAAAKVMQGQQPQGGSIVNIASMSGLRATGSSIAYCSSKAAVIHMTRCLARALGPDNIRVNAVAPGGVSDTRWQANRSGPAPAATGSPAAGTPMGRIANPADVADVALWLASEAPLTTGDVISVDGGRSLGG